MVHSQTLQLAAPRSGLELRRFLTLLAAVAIAISGTGLAPSNARANQTYPEALGATPYLTRKTVERIAKGDIGKLQGLRIGPFAPGAASRALPLGQAESLIGHRLPVGADPATPAWVVTVDAPPKANVLGEPTTATVFTDVINAVSGAVIDSCPGCRSVKS
jgi:hypothetical protein